MTNIFYFMHVSWVGCKHRPQFIAEHLREHAGVDVFHLKDYQTAHLVDRDRALNIKIFELFRLPFSRFRPIALLNSILLKRQIAKLMVNYDTIWVTHPSLFPLIEPSLSEGVQVIYDCMDDSLEFPAAKLNPGERDKIAYYEKALLERANIVFVSSNQLGALMINRGASKGKVATVNNAIELSNASEYPVVLPKAIESAFDGPGIKVVYVGTIADWFDFKLVLESLDRYPEIVCYLIGLADVTIPQHDRLKYLGMVEHRYVAGIMQRSDLLIMPFVLNDLVLSVNPIKLYEYINSGVPGLAVRYPETEQFDNYIHLYKTKEECFDTIKALVSGTLKESVDLQRKQAFAQANTWGARVQEMMDLLIRSRV